MADVHIKATFGEIGTLKEFTNLIAQRMKYLNETAKDSIAACAVITLKSIRAVTKVAKTKAKVVVKKDNSLDVSFTTQGGSSFKCVRTKNGARYSGNERIVFSKTHGIKEYVYSFNDEFGKSVKSYLIVAPSIGEAKQLAKNIVIRRIRRYKGLAKRALSMLMMKTNTKNVSDDVSARVSKKASDVTSVKSITNNNEKGGIYGLILEDNLNYALDSIKGGKSMVDISLKKAMNKIASVVNNRMKKILDKKPIDIPFPELVRKRK